MTIHVHGDPLAACTVRVATVATELGVEYKIHPVLLSKGEHKKPAYKEHQPFGEVPYIVDDANDNFELYESRPIAEYLVRQYAPKSSLLPGEDVKKWAKFEQAVSVEVSNFSPHASAVAWEKVVAP